MNAANYLMTIFPIRKNHFKTPWQKNVKIFNILKIMADGKCSSCKNTDFFNPFMMILVA